MSHVTRILHLMVRLNLILMSNACVPERIISSACVKLFPMHVSNACVPEKHISRCIFNICNERCAYIDLNQEKCIYGYAMDNCGVTFCAKGPGDICGDKTSHYGICGRGLTCGKCGRCTGCSLFSSRIHCFEDTNCIMY